MRAESAKAVEVSGLRGDGEFVSIDQIISTVLRWGVALAASIILLGVILYVAEAGWRAILFAPRGIPPGAETDPTSMRVVLDRLGPREPAAITDLGLLLLIVTPVITVAISLFSFVHERDWMYVGIAGFVLAMLMIGVFVGRA
jgi:uncharacterized membrane protein